MSGASDPGITITERLWERADLPRLYVYTAEQWQAEVREPAERLRAMYDQAAERADKLKAELAWFRRENKRLRARLGESESER